MIIRMLKDQKASVNGYTINDYLAGQSYDMGLSDSHIELARVFLHEKWAVEVMRQPINQEAPKAQAKLTRKRRK